MKQLIMKYAFCSQVSFPNDDF